jgi:hypothetical protein
MPVPIKIETTDQRLSARGGLILWREVIDQLDLKRRLAKALPTYKIATAASSYEKFEATVLAVAAGADCIDDMDRLALDPAFEAVTGELVTARSYGDYYRLFDAQMLKNLTYKLIDTALELRRRLGLLGDTFTLKLDSTNHEQHGEKIEGAATNYKGQWGLDSMLAFDELGFQYWIEPREGATYTSNGSPEVIDAVLRRLPRRIRRFVLADSGFCNNAFFTACQTANAKFVCAMRSLMYRPLISRVTNWHESKKILFHDKRACDVGSCVYYPKGGREALRVVFMRALRPNEQPTALFSDARYDYHAFVTNIGEHDGMKNEDVILFYRKRADIERFIAEIKNGFDMKHLPCKSLKANRAYALMGAFAQNLVRYTAYIENPTRPHFAKVLRFRVLMLPVQVVRHARSVTFRFMEHHAKEVKHWLEKIKTQFGFVFVDIKAAPPLSENLL